MKRTTQFAGVVEGLLQDLADIKGSSIRNLLLLVPAYERLDPRDLDAAADANIADAIGVLRSGVVLPGMYIERAHAIAASRINYGIAIEDVLRGYRVAIAEIMNRFMERALDIRLPAHTIVRGNQLLWQTADAYTSAISTAYQELVSERGAQDYAARHDLIARVFDGTLQDEELRASLRRFGLLAHEPVLGFFAEFRGRPTPRLPKVFIENGPVAPRHVSSYNTDTVLWGLTQQTLAARPDWMVVFGPALPAAQATESLRLADQLWQRVPASWKGVATAETLSWRGTPVSQPLSDSLQTKYLGPLHGETAAFQRTLWESVRAYIEHDRHVDTTADALFVHRNTLRHRLHRFESLTGAHLNATETIVELTLLANELDLKGKWNDGTVRRIELGT